MNWKHDALVDISSQFVPKIVAVMSVVVLGAVLDPTTDCSNECLFVCDVKLCALLAETPTGMIRVNKI